MSFQSLVLLNCHATTNEYLWYYFLLAIKLGVWFLRAGMIGWKYVGQEAGKVAKALSRHCSTEHRPALFLFPPCPHSSTHLFPVLSHTLLVWCNLTITKEDSQRCSKVWSLAILPELPWSLLNKLTREVDEKVDSLVGKYAGMQVGRLAF